MIPNKKICVVVAGQWGRNHIHTLNTLGCLGGIFEKASASLYKNPKLSPAL